MKNIPLSVLLPTYNERDNILSLIQQIRNVINPQEIIIIDDGSPDGTANVVDEAYRFHREIRIIVNKTREGLTKSLQKGIVHARGTYVVWMDADFSHPPELLCRMYSKIHSADIVIGSWLVKGGKNLRKELIPRICSNLINYICQIVFSKSIHTYTSGYVMTKKSLVTDFELKGDYGEYCIDFLVRSQRRNCKIIEIPFTCISRQKGLTKTAPDPITFFIKGLGYFRIILALLLSRQAL